jgi:hypothetical protein
VLTNLTGRPWRRVAVRVSEGFEVVSFVGVIEHFESGQRKRSLAAAPSQGVPSAEYH